MMHNERTQKIIFQKCSAEGSFINLSQVDTGLIKTMHDIALLDLNTLKKWNTGEKTGGDWNALLKIGYDTLHILPAAFLQLDNIQAERHECLFAYLCEKHPELDFDWNFLDKIRTLRNKSIYYGKPASYDDWKSVEFQLILYINTLKKAVEEKLNKQ